MRHVSVIIQQKVVNETDPLVDDEILTALVNSQLKTDLSEVLLTVC